MRDFVPDMCNICLRETCLECRATPEMDPHWRLSPCELPLDHRHTICNYCAPKIIPAPCQEPAPGAALECGDCGTLYTAPGRGGPTAVMYGCQQCHAVSCEGCVAAGRRRFAVCQTGVGFPETFGSCNAVVCGDCVGTSGFRAGRYLPRCTHDRCPPTGIDWVEGGEPPACAECRADLPDIEDPETLDAGAPRSFPRRILHLTLP